MPQAKSLRKVRARKGPMPDNVRAGKDESFLLLAESLILSGQKVPQKTYRHTCGKGEKAR